MGKIKRVRCPHCREINTVDIGEELGKHKKVVIRNISLSPPEPDIPKTMTVDCSHCYKKFKMNV